MFELRFPETDLGTWASRYPSTDEVSVVEVLAPRARSRGHLTRNEFLALCRWKTPRSQPICRRNSESLVRETTRVALAAGNEELKIGVLRLLAGVEWPTASVILHLCDRAPYPILDFRALWSLGYPQPPPYTFDFWRKYTLFVQGLARRSGRNMREVDRALWQYSKERQDGA
jgi:hypothetical protein